MISGLILAGGLGSRLGGEKPLVPLGGRPMLWWVARALQPVVEELVVSVAPGAPAGPYRRALGPSVRLVPDRRAGLGPLEGLLSSLPEVRGDHVCLAPCDAPFLTPRLYRLLQRAAVGRDGAVPRTEEVQALIGFLRRAPLLEAALRVSREGRQGSPTAVLKHLDLALVGADELRQVDPDLLFQFNVNTPRDLERASSILSLARAGRAGPPGSPRGPPRAGPGW